MAELVNLASNAGELNIGYRSKHGGIIKTGARASYQPNISDCTHAVCLLSNHCPPFVSARGQPAKPHV